MGLEPTWFKPGDFKSPASANSATAPNSSTGLIVPVLKSWSRLKITSILKKGNLLAGVYTPWLFRDLRQEAQINQVQPGGVCRHDTLYLSE